MFQQNYKVSLILIRVQVSVLLGDNIEILGVDLWLPFDKYENNYNYQWCFRFKCLGNGLLILIYLVPVIVLLSFLVTGVTKE